MTIYRLSLRPESLRPRAGGLVVLVAAGVLGTAPQLAAQAVADQKRLDEIARTAA